MSNAGCFKVTYTVSNACGSSSQIGYFTSDPANPNLRMSNTLEEQELKPIANTIYPNPTGGITTLSFTVKNDGLVNCVLSNLQGGAPFTIVENYSVSNGTNDLIFDTQNMPAGIYVYKVTDNSNTIQTGKLVIVK